MAKAHIAFGETVMNNWLSFETYYIILVLVF